MDLRSLEAVLAAAKDSGIAQSQIYNWRKALEPTEKKEKGSDEEISSSNLKEQLAEAKEWLQIAYKIFTEEQTKLFIDELTKEETAKIRSRIESKITGS